MSARHYFLSLASRKILLTTLVVVIGFALSGCVVKRAGYDVPQIPISDVYSNAADESRMHHGAIDSSKEHAVRPLVDANDGFAEWWRSFGSSELNRLVDRALANNPDLRIATLRIAQAKESAGQARAGLVPTLSSPMVVARQGPGGSVGIVPTGNGGPPQNSVQASLRADWRADVWGEQAAIAESADFQIRRAVFERDNTQSGVVAMLATNYVEYLSLNDRIELARDTARLLNSTLAAMERRVEMGDATLGDLEQEKATVFSLKATIHTLEQQREDALNGIAYIVGALPGDLKLSDAGLDSLGVPGVEPGVPSSLLLRRPDIRMMEARMLSADADIDVARARLFPSLDLSTQAGYSSNYLTPLFQPSIFFWNAVASLSASIFDGGRRDHARKYSEAVYAEMVETYVRTINQAMREVENSLSVIRLADKRLELQREAADAARRGWRISIRAFSMGGGDLMTLLDAQRNFNRFSDDYRRARADSLKGYIALFHALGGGVPSSASTAKTGRITAAGPAPISPDALPPASMSNVAEPAVEFFGIDRTADGDSPFWQIELPGVYHRSAVGAVWRDLQARFPDMMTKRAVLPRLVDKADEGDSSRDAWYQLTIARFDSDKEAADYCRQLIAQHERCRIVTSMPGAKSIEVSPESNSKGAMKPANSTNADLSRTIDGR